MVGAECPLLSIPVLLPIQHTHCALRAALSRGCVGLGAGRGGAGEGQAGDGALEAGAALAGPPRGGEGVSVGLDHTLVQAGVTPRTAVLSWDRVGALGRAGPPLAAHHLVQARADGAGLVGGAEGGARLMLLPLVKTHPSADWAAFPGRGHRSPTRHGRTRYWHTHHAPIQAAAALTVVCRIREAFSVAAVSSVEAAPVTHATGAPIQGRVGAGHGWTPPLHTLYLTP